MNSTLVGLREICTITKRSASTVWAWKREGMPCYQTTPKGKVFFDPEECLAWIKARSAK